MMLAGNSSSNHPLPPKPKLFHMSDLFQERGVWCFWLSAEEPVLQLVEHLHCVLSVSSNVPFLRRSQSRVYVTINPRYEAQEVWTWIYDLLETEALEVELNETWENAINVACETDDQADE